jgi:hypothetical protein
MKPMHWLNKLLSLIGCKLVGKRIKQNGVLHRTYSFSEELSTPANWDELTAFTAKKQAKKIAELKETELHAAQALEAVPVTSVCDTNLGVTGTLPDIQVEPSIQPPIAEPPIANRTGWVSRWGKLVAAKVIGWCSEGTRYRILYQTKCGEWDEALAFPSQMRWGPTLDNQV